MIQLKEINNSNLYDAMELEQSNKFTPAQSVDVEGQYERGFVMKCLLFIALLVLCTACGRGGNGVENGYDYTPPAYGPEIVPTPAPEITPTPPDTSAPGTPTPGTPPPTTPPPVLPPLPPMPEPLIPPLPPQHHGEPVTVTFTDNLTDLAFAFTVPSRWYEFMWGNRGTNGADAELMTLFLDRVWGGQNLNERFRIWEAVSRPDEWNQTIFAGWVVLQDPMQLWATPDAPTDVFVNGHGITFVEYRQTFNYVEDYVTVKWVFRRDGADYRDVTGRQRYYFAMLNVTYEQLDVALPYARMAMDSLRFTQGTPISLTPSAEAESIGITQGNFPRIGGSTSTIGLVNAIIQSMYEPSDDPVAAGDGLFYYWYYDQWGAARTIPSYELLLGGYFDMIIVPDPSAHVLALVEDAGIALEITPVALEALVFITHSDNPVTGITSEQLLAIYADRDITNWAQLGGNDGRIIPLIRNPHSGSQALMENMVLRGQNVHPDLLAYEIGGMMGMLSSIVWPHWSIWDIEEYLTEGCFALGYTVYFFLRNEQSFIHEWYAQGHSDRDWGAELMPLALDGVFPSLATFISGEYPLTTNYFAVIRADSPAGSPERAIVQWLTSDAGQEAIRSAGLGAMR